MLKLFIRMVVSTIRMVAYLSFAVIYGLAACVVAAAKKRKTS